jgi:hypothetical protein
MPAEVVTSKILKEHGVESVTVMDDYGTAHPITIPFSAVATRQASIDAAIALMNGNQLAFETYAEAANAAAVAAGEPEVIDLVALKADGQIKKDKAKGVTL